MRPMKLHIFRIANGAAADDGKLPDRIKVLSWGDNPGIAGLNPKLGAHTLRAFAARMQAAGLDRVAIDFEHNTVPGTPHYDETPEPRAVAAYGIPRLIDGDGLWLEDLVWTPHGREHALNYFDLSPTVHIDKRTGEVDLLHSVALTRAGVVEGLTFYSVEANIGHKPQGEEHMDRKFWMQFAGLEGDDVTDEQLQAGIAARFTALAAEAAGAVRTELTTLSATVAALKPADGEGGGEHETELTALSGTVAGLKDELTALSGELVGMRRQNVCDQAAREGKVIPLSAEQIAKTEPGVLADMVSKLPVTVPIDRRTPEHIQALSADAASTALKRVAQTCGMDPAHVLEVNKK